MYTDQDLFVDGQVPPYDCDNMDDSTPSPTKSPTPAPTKIPTAPVPTTSPTLDVSIHSCVLLWSMLFSVADTMQFNFFQKYVLQPTDSPTSSYSPTTSDIPLQRLGNNGSPAEFFPLGQCQGDCDSKADCQVCITKTWLVYYHFISFQ